MKLRTGPPSAPVMRRALSAAPAYSTVSSPSSRLSAAISRRPPVASTVDAVKVGRVANSRGRLTDNARWPGRAAAVCSSSKSPSLPPSYSPSNPPSNCGPISRLSACTDTSASLLNASRVPASPDPPMLKVRARSNTLAGAPSIDASSMTMSPAAVRRRLPPRGAWMRPLSSRSLPEFSVSVLPADASISTLPPPTTTPRCVPAVSTVPSMAMLAPPNATSWVPSSPMYTAVRVPVLLAAPPDVPRMLRLGASPSCGRLAPATPTRSRLPRPMSTAAAA